MIITNTFRKSEKEKTKKKRQKMHLKKKKKETLQTTVKILNKFKLLVNLPYLIWNIHDVKSKHYSYNVICMEQ